MRIAFRVKNLMTLLLIAGILQSCSNNAGGNGDAKSDSSLSNSAKRIANLFESDWEAPDTSTIAHDDAGDLIRYGRELVVNTGYYLGSSGKVKHWSNGLNCQNCHLDAGTKLYANSYSAVYSIYPKFRARSGTIEHLEKRINDCMERSLNGNKLDSLSREMRAMVAYINWVGKDVKKGVSPVGAAVVELPFLNRSADTVKGKIAFQKYCVSCHGNNGEGKMNIDHVTYLYPPLWGPHSYNTAAGMYRLTRFAGFIKSNMPNLTSSYEKPTLTDEEAWDIAAFVNSMPRPDKKFKDDWPDISKKPFDHPFGPYKDQYSEARHKYGPFAELSKAVKKK